MSYRGNAIVCDRTLVIWLFVVMLTPAIGAEQLALDGALAIAFDRSPTIREARHGLEISRRNLLAQRAALKSKFSLILTPYEFTRDRVFNALVSDYNTQEQTHVGGRLSIRQPIEFTDGSLSVVQALDWREASSSFAGSGSQKTYSNSLFLRYSQPLFTYNRTRLNLESLELDLENAQLNFAIQKLQIENQVTRLFLDLYFKQRSVAISVEELKNATQSLEIIQSKVNAGISAREEAYQADLTRANSRASLENGQLQYDDALDRFKIQLGQPLDLEVEVTADVSKQLVEVDLDRATAYGIENRMELRQRDLAVRQAMDDLIRTGAQNEFRGTIDVTYGLIGTDESLADLYSSPTRNQAVALQLNIPLFDWGEREHRMAAAREKIASRELSAEEERRQILLEIRQAHRNLRSQVTQITIAEKSVENARRTYDINLERYRNGDLSSKDIAFYQDQLSRQQLNKVRALIDYRLALLDLKVRTLWDFAADEPVVTLDPN